MSMKLLVDNDGSNFLGTLCEDYEDIVGDMVAECPEEVTTYLLCPGAGTYYYPTRIADRYYPELDKLYNQGHDPIRTMLEGLRARGIETFLTFRTNDVHSANEPDHPLVPTFRKKNPDYVVDPDATRAGTGGWEAYCLDYSRREVRDYYLSIIRELADLYEIDGLQLDWMRFTRHLSGTPDEVWQKRDCITGFIQQVREVLGSDVHLTARIPTTPEACRHMGLDISAWVKDGLVDHLITCPFLTTDFEIPVESIREITGAGVPIHAGMDFNHSGQAHCPESLRATALSLLECGADGIYLFNFPCWTERLATRPYHWLKGYPENAAQKPLLFSVSSMRHRIPRVDQSGVLPISISSGESGTVSVSLPEKSLPADRALILVHADDDIGLALNGKELRCLPELSRPELFTEYRESDFAENARYFVFRASGDDVQPGANRIELRATRSSVTVSRVNVGLW